MSKGEIRARRRLLAERAVGALGARTARRPVLRASCKGLQQITGSLFFLDLGPRTERIFYLDANELQLERGPR